MVNEECVMDVTPIQLLNSKPITMNSSFDLDSQKRWNGNQPSNKEKQMERFVVNIYF